MRTFEQIIEDLCKKEGHPKKKLTHKKYLQILNEAHDIFYVETGRGTDSDALGRFISSLQEKQGWTEGLIQLRIEHLKLQRLEDIAESLEYIANPSSIIKVWPEK